MCVLKVKGFKTAMKDKNNFVSAYKFSTYQIVLFLKQLLKMKINTDIFNDRMVGFNFSKIRS